MTGNEKINFVLPLIITVLLIPSLFINVGQMPLIADEATRAAVSLEMEYSGNLLIPTINAEPYYNKPPLYNWVLLSFFRIFGQKSELIIRLPVILSLLLYGLFIFLFTKKQLGKRNAFLSAAIFISCGRILFYDSMLGLIDTTFSLLVFTNFMLIYHLLKKEKYFRLFLFSWLITAIAFLMKGLPSLLFQVITLSVVFLWKKRFRVLTNVKHLPGILLFLLITGIYYFLAYRENPEGQYFLRLFTESARRTFLEYGLADTIVNIFSFPFIQLYHLLPWSVLIIFAFRKSFYRRIRKSEFLSFLALVFIANIPVYWISVETYPRYMFMLYPFLLILLTDAYTNAPKDDRFRKTTDLILASAMLLSIPAIIWGMTAYDFVSDVNFTTTGLLLIAFILLLFVSFILMPRRRPEIIIILLLGFRISFNLVVITERYAESRTVLQKQQALKVAELTKDHELKLHFLATCSHETTFYISEKRGNILEKTAGPYIPGNYYLFDGRDSLREGETVIFEFETRWENSPLKLSRFNEN